MMRLNERGFSNLMALGFLLLAICGLFIYHGLKGTDRGDVSQPVALAPAAPAPQPEPAAAQQTAEPEPDSAAVAVAAEPTIDAALYERLESAIADGRSLVGNARSRAMRIVTPAPQQSTPEWVQFRGALSQDLSVYEQGLNEARRGVAVSDPAHRTIEPLQSMLADITQIADFSNIPASSGIESRFAQAEQQLNAAWEALQKTQ